MADIGRGLVGLCALLLGACATTSGSVGDDARLDDTGGKEAAAGVKPGAVIGFVPAEGFWLKVLDAEGNFLPDLSLTFKQGNDVIAQLRTNSLANVFFTQRQPFAGQPVDVSAEGCGWESRWAGSSSTLEPPAT